MIEQTAIANMQNRFKFVLCVILDETRRVFRKDDKLSNY